MDLAEEACDVLPSEYSDQCKGNFLINSKNLSQMIGKLTYKDKPN